MKIENIRKFRIDMLKLSQGYPFLKRIVVTKDAWEELCGSLDRDIEAQPGTVSLHIKDREGSIRFHELLIECEDCED